MDVTLRVIVLIAQISQETGEQEWIQVTIQTINRTMVSRIRSWDQWVAKVQVLVMEENHQVLCHILWARCQIQGKRYKDHKQTWLTRLYKILEFVQVLQWHQVHRGQLEQEQGELGTMLLIVLMKKKSRNRCRDKQEMLLHHPITRRWIVRHLVWLRWHSRISKSDPT